MSEHIGLDKKLKASGIGRFQVMALLQAARYYVLYGDKDRAKSFGLNRAIFYAWAKHYGPRRIPYKSLKVEDLEKLYRKQLIRGKGDRKCPEGYTEVAGECIQVSLRGYFVIGGQEQHPTDFDRQVSSRLRILLDYRKAWNEAVEYVKKFPRKILKDPQKFYKLVYEPVRDTFFKYLLMGVKPSPKKEVIEKLYSLEEMVEKSRSKQKSLFDYTEKNNKISVD